MYVLSELKVLSNALTRGGSEESLCTRLIDTLIGL